MLFGGAIGRLVVPGPSHRITETVGVAHLRNEPSKRFAVNIAPLLPYMHDADWTSDHWVLWKIPVVVELRNGQKLMIDSLGGKYTIDGVPGVFSNFDMSRQESERYDAELTKILQEWPNKSAQTTPGLRPSVSDL